jgi:hypothetical protein
MLIKEECGGACRYEYPNHVPTTHSTAISSLTCKIILSEGVFINFTQHNFQSNEMCKLWKYSAVLVYAFIYKKTPLLAAHILHIIQGSISTTNISVTIQDG